MIAPSSAAAAEPLAPVYLVTGEADPAGEGAASAAPGAAAVLIVALAVVALGAVVLYRRRAAERMDPADLALRQMARRLRLRRADRAALRALADSGVAGWPTPLHPVALLVSRHAFEAAAAAAPMCCPESVTSRIDRIRWRAFGEASPHSREGRSA